MQVDGYISAFFALLALAVRWLLSGGGHVVASPDWGLIWRFAPIVVLPFAAWRSLRRGAPLLGIALIAIEVYFIYNRLTVFSSKPLVLAELLGNLGLMLLGLLFITPQKYWRKPPPEGRPHA